MEAPLDQASNQEILKKELADLLEGIEGAQEEFFNCLDYFANHFDIEIGKIRDYQGKRCPQFLTDFLEEVEDQNKEILDKAATLAEELCNLNGILHKHNLL